MADTSLIFVLDAHLPFVRHPDRPGCPEESRLFDAINHTYLPLLRSCTALETEGVPFKLAIAFAPVLCEMLSDKLLQDRYIDNLNRSMEFGLAELERCAASPETRELIKRQLDLLQLNRRDYIDIYERNILKKFDYFATHGFIELLATTATSCFLPLYSDIPEAVSAQIETGLISYRRYFTSIPAGFWIPALGWFHGLEDILKSYGFSYTIVDSHGLLFAVPPADTGVFAPASCSNGLGVFARDKISCLELTALTTGCIYNSAYLDVDHDIGFELDESSLQSLFDIKQGRRHTGYRYWNRSQDHSALYDHSHARTQLLNDAEAFLEKRLETLGKASGLLEGAPVSQLFAFPASLFGQTWFEGVEWLEAVCRRCAERGDVSLAAPSSAIPAEPREKTVVPCYSSWNDSGYAEEVLNSLNDWMYPYVRKATLRMIDLAERFPDDTGLKERSLNMAARELLLAQTMDWALMMNETDRSEYARQRFEESVKAFTVVYESLGSNFISTEWLTTTEKKHNLFSEANYRVFSRKK